MLILHLLPSSSPIPNSPPSFTEHCFFYRSKRNLTRTCSLAVAGRPLSTLFNLSAKGLDSIPIQTARHTARLLSLAKKSLPTAPVFPSRNDRTIHQAFSTQTTVRSGLYRPQHSSIDKYNRSPPMFRRQCSHHGRVSRSSPLLLLLRMMLRPLVATSKPSKLKIPMISIAITSNIQRCLTRREVHFGLFSIGSSSVSYEPSPTSVHLLLVKCRE